MATVSTNLQYYSEADYDKAAHDYLVSLPLGHFMEATPQATQRKITLESMDLVLVQRPDVQTFNELLIQYLSDDAKPQIRQIVPDNMIVMHDEPIHAVGSYNLPLQPVIPLVVLEYVSKGSERKDYNGSFAIYEQNVHAPYYLLFYPDNQELSLFQLKNNQRYTTVLPNEQGRLAIPELELEVAILDQSMRYLFRGELLPLPGDLLTSLNATKQKLKESEKAKAKIEKEMRKTNKAKEKAEKEKAELEKKNQEAEEKLQRERDARLALEAELERMRAELAQSKQK